MRPKKRILLIAPDELRLSVRRFLLEARGYRVIGTCDPAEAIALFEADLHDVVVCDLEVGAMEGDVIIARLKAVSRDTPMVLVSEMVRSGDIAHSADVFLGKRRSLPQDLIERLRVMAVRKRDPKKPPASVLPVAAEVAHG